MFDQRASRQLGSCNFPPIGLPFGNAYDGPDQLPEFPIYQLARRGAGSTQQIERVRQIVRLELGRILVPLRQK